MIQVFKLLERLDSCQLRYMVIGGMAAVFHGSSTATLDLDISISAGDHSEIQAHIKDFCPHLNIDGSLANEFEEFYARAETFELFGRQIRVISLSDLITLKKRLGREKDLIAVKELELILKRRS